MNGGGKGFNGIAGSLVVLAVIGVPAHISIWPSAASGRSWRPCAIRNKLITLACGSRVRFPHPETND
jgi:hypothetical protein